VRENTDFLVSKFVFAHFTLHFFINDKVGGLQRVALLESVDALYYSQLFEDFLVLFLGHLEVKHRLEEAGKVVIFCLKIPVFRDHV
jgi:hypothetical protein